MEALGKCLHPHPKIASAATDIHLKCFAIELPCFQCDTFEIQKCSVTESYGISVALVVSAMGSGRGGGVMARLAPQKVGTTPEVLPAIVIDELDKIKASFNCSKRVPQTPNVQ